MLTAACMGRAGLNRMSGLATATLVIAAELPDIDIVFNLGGGLTGFQHHRGITHTFLGSPFVAAGAVGIIYGIYRLMLARGKPPKSPPKWRVLFFLAWLSALSHILLDFTNSYGIRPFEPFSYKWYSWDIMPIVEPPLLAALILALVVPGLLGLINEEIGTRGPRYRGRGGAIFGLVILLALWGARDFQHRRALAAMYALEYHGQEAVRLSAYPYNINFFTWYGVVETEGFFETMHVDSRSGEVDPEGRARIYYKPAETPITLAAKDSRLGHIYLDWAAYPIVEVERDYDSGGHAAHFIDLRYAPPERRTPGLDAYCILDPKLNIIEQRLAGWVFRRR